MNIKKICISISFLILTGCGGSILDDTALDTVSIQIQGISVTSGSTTASVIWITDIASTHQIVYGVTSGSYTESTTLSNAETTTHLVDFSGLVTDQIYYFKIICSKNGYKTIQSPEYSFTTSSTVTVTLLTAGNITTTSADITWTTGVETTHLVEYGTTAGVYTQSTVQSSTPSTSHTVSLTGLTSGTEYFFRVKNFHVTLPYSANTGLSFSTTGIITVSGISESSDATSVTIGWTTNLPTTHSIDYGTSSGSLTSSTTQSSTASTSHSVTLSGLTQDIVYFYKINNTHATLGTFSSSERRYPTAPTLEQKLRGIWMVGGLTGNLHASVIGAVDMYDPVTDLWYTSVTTLPTAVSFAGTASIKISNTDHRIYVFGGFDNTGAVQSLVQYYTIETNTWSTGTVIAGGGGTPRANINAVRLNDKFYIMGGSNSDASSAYTTNTTTYEYNPAGDSWTALAAFGATSTERFMLASGSVIYNLSGRNAFATLTPVTTNHLGLNLYQATAGQETGPTETVLASARTGISGDIYESPAGDVMIISGGFTAMAKSATATSVVVNTTSSTATNVIQYLAYPFTGTLWVIGTASGATFPARGFGSSVVYYSASLSPSYRIYFFGGTDSLASASASGSTGAGWLNTPQPPNPWTYTWTSITNMPSGSGRYGFTAVKIQQ